MLMIVALFGLALVLAGVACWQTRGRTRRKPRR
jgi:hypothetical protein